MGDWFGGVIDQLIRGHDLDDVEGPTVEVGENERVVGELDVTGQKLWCLREVAATRSRGLYAELLRKSAEEIGRGELSDEFKRIHRDTSVANAQREAIDRLLWTQVHSLFPEATDPDVNVGIRAGFQVVVFKPPSPDQVLADLLTSLGNN